MQEPIPTCIRAALDLFHLIFFCLSHRNRLHPLRSRIVGEEGEEEEEEADDPMWWISPSAAHTAEEESGLDDEREAAALEGTVGQAQVTRDPLQSMQDVFICAATQNVEIALLS